MYNSFQLVKKYIHYYLSAHNSKGHGMHSPFVFDFILNVLNNKSNYQYPKEVEFSRKKLKKDRTVLPVIDLGAGSRKTASNERRVSDIAKTALKPPKFGQFFYRFVKHYQPKTILELGTSLGITTAYMAFANPDADIITIEGSEAVANRARQSLHQLGIKNVQVVQGAFDDLLPSVLNLFSTIDLAYIDGNHLFKPTIYYFHQILERSGKETFLIFDDIHWSEEMEQAWEYIKMHQSVRTTIDLFFIGIVLLRPSFKEKQHFQIRF